MTSCIVPLHSAGAHTSDRQQAALPGHEVDDHRVPGQQAQTHTNVRKTIPGTAGRLLQGGQRGQTETRTAQDGRIQQSLRPLSLVVVDLSLSAAFKMGPYGLEGIQFTLVKLEVEFLVGK